MRHMHNMAKVMLATGLIVGYGYIMEAFFGWYSGNKYERFMIWNRMHGPYSLVLLGLILCNIITPQFVDQEDPLEPARALDHFVHREHRHVARALCDRRDEPASRLPAFVVGNVPADAVGLGMFIGTIGFFFTLLFLFIRFLPMISIFEMRTILPEAEVEE